MKANEHAHKVPGKGEGDARWHQGSRPRGVGWPHLRKDIRLFGLQSNSRLKLSMPIEHINNYSRQITLKTSLLANSLLPVAVDGLRRAHLRARPLIAGAVWLYYRQKPS